MGSALVDTSTNEIPVARELCGELELAGRRVALDPLHTQTQTARDLGLEHGADYRLTNSLFMEWRSHQPMAKYKTTTNFHPIMGENNLAKAMRFVTNKRPCL